ncbi:MAG: DUF1456 family protein, partial [Porticoccaceae bacterium]|nr:DUF1456 family protein [Porticoccaceae bacterium]
LAILDLVDFTLSKHELSAFFRKPGHKHHRPCHDQVLRNFLHGLQLKYRPEGGGGNESGEGGEGESQPDTGYAWKTMTEISGDSD